MRLTKRGCVFSMVNWPAFRMGQYRANDHPYDAPQFKRFARTAVRTMSDKDFMSGTRSVHSLSYLGKYHVKTDSVLKLIFLKM